MPRSLFHRLVFALAGLSVVALLIYAWLQYSGFRRDYADYLDQLSQDRLRGSLGQLLEDYRAHGDWEFLRGRTPLLINTLDIGPKGQGHPRQPPPPRERGEHAPPMPGPPPMRPPPLAVDSPEQDLAFRIQLRDAAGELVAGNPNTATAAIAVPIVLDGRQIGTISLAPMPKLANEVEREFVRRQRERALVTAAIVLVAALALAVALARSLLAPLRELMRGAQRLTAGDYAMRLGAQRRDELGALAQDFNRLAESLERARNARRQWLADIAHELRTPLATLSGEIQALHDGVRPFSAQTVRALQGDCQRLHTLIDDLYQLSLSDAGALEYVFEPVDLATLLDDAFDAHVGAFAQAGLTLRRAARAEQEFVVRGDHRRLAQLLANVLSNCLRYVQTPGEVLLAITEEGDAVELTIADSGPGVPAEALPHLFERLYRVDAARGRDSGGAGLGLSICRSIVDAHAGQISAARSDLGGLRIQIRLPRWSPAT